MQASEPISSTSLRYVSQNIQFSRMKNVILPQVSSQPFSDGYSDFISDVPVQIDSKLNAYESSFYMDSSLYSQQDQLDGALAFRSQSFIHNQSGPSLLMTVKSLDCPSFGSSTKSPTMPSNYDYTITQQQLTHLERHLPGQIKENAICSTRKRPVENANVGQKRSHEIFAGNKSPQSEWTPNKKKAVFCQEQLQDYQIRKDIKEVQRERVPVRRTQKLADRITALQKLVSPYGKTDTASVLHEASIFIKVLQDQIENMFHILSCSSDDKFPQSKITGGKEFDLRSKGLCLVPVSFSQKLTKDDAINQFCT